MPLLQKLEVLSVNDASLSDFSFVRNLSEKLHTLALAIYVKDAKFDIAWLSKYANLYYLELMNAASAMSSQWIKTLNALSEMKQLETLSLYKVPLKDITILNSITNLKYLKLERVKIDSLDNLILNQLEVLELNQLNQLKYINIIQTLPKLKKLYMKKLKHITEIPQLSKDHQLEYIKLHKMTSLSDCSGLYPLCTIKTFIEYGSPLIVNDVLVPIIDNNKIEIFTAVSSNTGLYDLIKEKYPDVKEAYAEYDQTIINARYGVYESAKTVLQG